MGFTTLVSAFLISVSAQARIPTSPPNFAYQNGEAVFIDMQEATYNLVYDVANRTAKAHSEITFTMDQAGYPVFDLVPNIELAQMDGENVNVELVRSPDHLTDVRVIEKFLNAGRHTLVIENSISKYLKFAPDGVANAFFMDDSVDRGFLEVFLPSNLQYDQYKMHFNIQVTGTTNVHEVLTTGVLKSTGTNSWSVDFPQYFNSAALYLHIAKIGYFEKLQTTFTNKDGKVIPVLIYKKAGGPENLNRFLTTAKESILNLETNFIAWPHPNLVIYATESEEGMGGGMEHCGATMSSYSALEHELSHSFFGRGFLPADGNSAWIDEALAMWSEDNYSPSSVLNDNSDNMGNVGDYYRSTKRTAYTTGMDLMAYFEGKTGKMKPFLKDFLTKHVLKTITNADFQNELQVFTGQNFSREFNTYVFGPAFNDTFKVEGLAPRHFSEEALESLVK
jgi:hypothetical protein